MAGNVLLGGVVGAAIDAGSGAYNSLYPNPVKVELKPRDGRRRPKPAPTPNPSASPRR